MSRARAAACRAALLLVVCACERPDVGVESSAVLNGADDRREATHPAVVALMWSHRLAFSGGEVILRAPTEASAFGVCDDEPFAEQPAAATCSGAIVGPAVVITAAHCAGATIEAAREHCHRTWIVRGFAERDGAVHIGADDVFACADVLALDAEGDLAVLALDRPVSDPRATARPAETRVATGDEIAVWSHGAGLPLKLEEHAKVVDAPSDRDTFTAATDTFEGSSGGLATNAQGELVGMVLRGAADWRLDGRCQRAAQATAPEETFLQGSSVARALRAEGLRQRVADVPAALASVCGDQICGRDERTSCAADCAAYLDVPAAWLDDPSLWHDRVGPSNAGCSMRPRGAAAAPGWALVIAVGLGVRARRRQSSRPKAPAVTSPNALARSEAKATKTPRPPWPSGPLARGRR